MGLIPLIFLIIINVLVHRKLVERQRWSTELGVQYPGRQLRLESRQVRTLFGVVVLFLIGHVFRAGLNLHEMFATDRKMILLREQNRGCFSPFPLWNLMLQILQRLLVALSHSGNILIYCLSSKSFCMLLRRQILCRNSLGMRSPSSRQAAIRHRLPLQQRSDIDALPAMLNQLISLNPSPAAEPAECNGPLRGFTENFRNQINNVLSRAS